MAVLAGMAVAVAVVIAIGDVPTAAQAFGLVAPAQALAQIGAVIAIGRYRGSPRPTDELGLRFGPGDPWGLLVGAGLQFVLALLTLLFVELLGVTPEQEVARLARESFGPLTRLSALLALVLLGPVAEELVFRGLLLRSLLRRMSEQKAIGISAAAFAAVHLLDPGVLLLIPSLVVVGWVLGRQAVRSGRLGRPIYTHIGFNLISVVLLFGQVG